ncbi:MAG: hypothetical protein ACLFVJ_18355 [Persicimonas sp.]
MSSKPQQKKINVVPLEPPPEDQFARRPLRFAEPGEKKNRYHMPRKLESSSPVGYRERVSFSKEEAEQAVELLSLARPTRFVEPDEPVTEREIFEETSLGVTTSRQSTNFRGHRQVTLGPEDSSKITQILRGMAGRHGEPLDDAEYTHVVLSRPYRTPFTLLLTFVGHEPIKSLVTVFKRALDKRLKHIDDIPSVGYLQHLHVGVLADAMERAAVVASDAKRRANVFMGPFTGAHKKTNKAAIREIEKLAGLTLADRAAGWRVALVAQVGTVPEEDRPAIEPATCRKLGANLLAFRSERIQPGVNAEDSAPAAYQERQDMDVPEELTVMAGRAAYNAFVHWTGCERERSKELLLLERIDVLTDSGKERLREVRKSLGRVSDEVIDGLPLWADLLTGKALSRNAERGRKAFALAGQRIYIGGLDRNEIDAAGIDWQLAVRAVGAASARGALVAELMGCVNIPDGCDLLSGICLMAGPVNQNDIGKEFFGHDDLLTGAFPDKDPTSLLVWTLKAKTVADPIGNEEQLLNEERKGALVDLRPGPHDVVCIKRGSSIECFRQRGETVNHERAFFDVGNFATGDDGEPIEGNRGEPWPEEHANAPVW